MEKNSVIIDGSTVYYWVMDRPKVETIVLLHGFTANHKGLIPLARELSSGFRVILVDLPGYGQSQPLKVRHTIKNFAGWTADFLKALDLEGPILFGHSFSGSILLAFAGLHPEIAAQVVLANPVTVADGYAPLLTKAYYGIGSSLPKRLRNPWLARKLVRYMTALFLLETKDKQVRRRVIAEDLDRLGEVKADVIIDGYRSYRETDFMDLARRAKAPVLIIAGDKDKVAPLATLTRLAGEIKHSQLCLVSGTGHISCTEHPAEIAAVIRQWTQKQGVADRGSAKVVRNQLQGAQRA